MRLGLESQKERIDRSARRRRPHNRCARSGRRRSATIRSIAARSVTSPSKSPRRSRARVRAGSRAVFQRVRVASDECDVGTEPGKLDRDRASDSAAPPVISAVFPAKFIRSLSPVFRSRARNFADAGKIAHEHRDAERFGMRFINEPSTPLAPNSTTISGAYRKDPFRGVVPAHFVDDRADEIRLDRPRRDTAAPSTLEMTSNSGTAK